MNDLDQALKEYQKAILLLLDESFLLSEKHEKHEKVTSTVNKKTKIVLESSFAEEFGSAESSSVNSKIGVASTAKNVDFDQVSVVMEMEDKPLKNTGINDVERKVSHSHRSKSNKANTLKWIGSITTLSTLVFLGFYFFILI